MYWQELSFDEMNRKVSSALEMNLPWDKKPLFGVPGSWLNRKVFPSLKSLEKAPFLRTMVENPNHIGCHTFGESEKFFEGTHEIEREVIRICAEEILDAKSGCYDGYIASGGTEGNIQAVWSYRNYLVQERNLSVSEIGVVYTSDTHYSVHKACNLLCLKGICIPIENSERQVSIEQLKECLINAQAEGIKAFIFVLTMGSTMFGAVDDIDKFIKVIRELQLEFFIHVDAAFGGFIYPFTTFNRLKMSVPEISSFSLDGHKVLQAPYGTGIFLIKRPYLNYVMTDKASYVKGNDKTLCGSRSGALAVALWLILHSYGSEGWTEFISGLLEKTELLTTGLRQKNLSFFQQPGVNVVTLDVNQVDTKLLEKYNWVSDDSKQPRFFKAVVMDHVNSKQIKEFLNEI